MLASVVEAAAQVPPVDDLAVCSGPGSVDPVLSAIEAYRFARTRYHEAVKMLGVLEAELPSDITRPPRAILGRVLGPDGKFKDCSAFSHRQIDEWFDRRIESERRICGNFDPAQANKLRAEAHKAFDEDLSAILKAQRESGFTSATEQYRQTNDAELAAMETLCSTIPTTLAGAHALVSFLLLDDLFDRDSDLRELQLEALRSVEQFLATLVRDQITAGAGAQNLPLAARHRGPCSRASSPTAR